MFVHLYSGVHNAPTAEIKCSDVRNNFRRKIRTRTIDLYDNSTVSYYHALQHAAVNCGFFVIFTNKIRPFCFLTLIYKIIPNRSINTQNSFRFEVLIIAAFYSEKFTGFFFVKILY